MHSRLFLKRVLVVGALLLPLMGCGHHRVAATVPTRSFDAILGIQVRQLDGSSIQHGLPAHFRVTVLYQLNSYEKGFVSLNLVQSPSPESCPGVSAEKAYTVPALAEGNELQPISKGENETTFSVTWKSGAGAAPPVGAITFDASLWSAEPKYKFLTESFGTQTCLRIN
jgi:hypothetical protein